MKIKNQIILLTIFLSVIVTTTPLRAQNTAFTYQGRLQNLGSPANGTYDFRFRLASDPLGNNYVGGPILTNGVPVTNGLFTAVIDFGTGIFTGSNYWLEVDVRTNGGTTYTTLNPLQALTPTPYAITAGNVVSGGLPATYSSAVAFNNAANSFTGSGAGLTALSASSLSSGTVPDGRLSGNVALLDRNQTFTGQNVFSQSIGVGNPAPVYSVDALAGQAVGRFITTNTGYGSVIVLQNNLTNLNSYYLGAINFNNARTTPGQIGYISVNPTNQNDDYLEFRAGGAVGLQILADSRGAQAPSLKGGYGGNLISQAGDGGDAIVGGGFSGYPNVIASNSSGVFIGAGSANSVGPNVNDSVIAGGGENEISSPDSVIGGGFRNNILTNSAHATIAGGYGNAVGGVGAFIGGGGFDGTQYSGNQATGNASVIVGGLGNVTTNEYAVIGGGYHNTNHANFGTVSGGSFNTASSDNATVAGGVDNTASGGHATVSGGFANTASNLGNTSGATVCGGDGNTASGDDATVCGGLGNTASGNDSFAAGADAKAIHTGAFVWADAEGPGAFSSVTNNTFNIRAQNGVWLSTNTSVYFGSQVRQMLNLWSTNYGIGVQGATTYFRSGKRFSWFQGGQHSDVENDPGTGGSVLMTLTSAGLTVNGTFVSTSDRNAKARFSMVNDRKILDAVAALPISRWHYTNDMATPHIGPMAQDFYAAFQVGPDDKHITTVDEGGVALAAIQGLNRKLQDEMNTKDAEIQQLKQTVSALRKTVSKLAATKGK